MATYTVHGDLKEKDSEAVLLRNLPSGSTCLALGDDGKRRKAMGEPEGRC